MTLIDELRWRGMFHDMMPGTDEHLSTGQPVTGYIGFDPTAPSLHIGNLATIMLLVHLQRAGHRPVALVGGATGMIGDPSGKSAERNLLDETTLRANQAGIRAQLEKFLDFSEGPTGARVVNNYDWFKEIGFLQFLRDVGKHLTVNYMMAKDSVKNRISRGSNVLEVKLKELSHITLDIKEKFIQLENSPDVSSRKNIVRLLSGLSEALENISNQSSPDHEDKMEALMAKLYQQSINKGNNTSESDASSMQRISFMTGAEGISYTEFSYQLLQGYDFFHLYETLGTTLQMGASDQWGNITTGTELIRRLTGGEGKAFALTGQLITKADGTKYGKSETGTVWLNPAMTSPYQFYQFFLNSADADAPRLIRVFTLLSQEEIESLEAEHAQAPHLRTLQKALAKDVTIRVHSQAAYEAALAASQVLFGGGDLAALQGLDEQTLLDVFAGVPRLEVPRTQAKTLSVVDLLSEATSGQIFPSKGETRKMIQSGGVSINRQKIADANQAVAELPLLQDKYLVAQKGKKNYYLLTLV